VDVSKSAIATAGFAVEDKYFIKWSRVKRVKQNAWFKWLLTLTHAGWKFDGLKALMAVKDITEQLQR